jgi:hypothetical protein
MRDFNETTGPRPSKSAFKLADKYARHSSGDNVALAMVFRPHGATQAEIVSLLGHPHRNVVKKLVDRGEVTKVVLPSVGRSVRLRLVKK